MFWMSSFISTSIGVLVGGIITWLVARHYYVRAGRELRGEASELRRLNDLMLRGMEDAGLVKWNRDASGKQIGLLIEAQATFSGRTTMSANPTVTHYSEEHSVE